MKKALITGVTGQDGSYLSEFLLSKGYEVHGMIRRASVFTSARIEHLREVPGFFLHHGDLADSSNVHSLMASIKPDEIYNLGAQSHVGVSFEVPEYSANIDGLGTLRLLDAMKTVVPDARFYQAGTSETFGGFPETIPQNEMTVFHPRSPYGAAKLYAYWLAVNYREAYGMHISNGLLFNHESPRRGETFVTKKVTKAVANISKGLQDSISLGNLYAKRDWGYAPEYVVAMWMMLQQDIPNDYVVATGKSVFIKDWVSYAFYCAGIPIYWEGDDTHEVARIEGSDKIVVKIDPAYYRPSEVAFLEGDSSKIKDAMGWESRLSWQDICAKMVEYDMKYDSYGGEE